MEFRTERLVLRQARADDLEPLHAILSDPRAMAYWSSLPHGDLQATRDWLSSMIAIEPGEGEDFIIECDGQLIGKAGVYRFPDIGYILHPDHWGRGYAREALTFVIDRAFDVHGLDKDRGGRRSSERGLARIAQEAELPGDAPGRAYLGDRRPMVRQHLPRA